MGRVQDLARRPTTWVIALVVVAALVLAVARPWSSSEDRAQPVGTDGTSTTSQPTTATTAPTTSVAPPTTTAPPPTTATTAAPAAPAAPRTLATGQLAPRDYQVTGQVAIVEGPDGRRSLQISGLVSEDGPDLVVWLSTAPAAAPASEIAGSGPVELGPLQGLTGDQTYAVPDEVDLGSVASVVIWCRQVSAPFGTATLVPA